MTFTTITNIPLKNNKTSADSHGLESNVDHNLEHIMYIPNGQQLLKNIQISPQSVQSRRVPKLMIQPRL